MDTDPIIYNPEDADKEILIELSWFLVVDTLIEEEARNILDSLTSSLDRKISEPRMNKFVGETPSDISFRFTIQIVSTSWNNAIVEAMMLGQVCADAWKIYGKAEKYINAFGSEFSFPKIKSLAWYLKEKFSWGPKMSDAKTKQEIWSALVMEAGPVRSFYYRTPTISTHYLKMVKVGLAASDQGVICEHEDRKYLNLITLPLSKEAEFKDIQELVRQNKVLTQEQIEKLENIRQQHDLELRKNYHRILKEKGL